jgi:ketosteroid isomerase-like protein
MTAAELFRNVWDAFTQGRMRDLSLALHPEVEWRPSVGGEVFRGPEDLDRWLEHQRRAWQSLTIVYEDMREVADDCVIAFGRLTAFDYGGEQAIDTDVAWVAEFRDDLLLRAASFFDRDDALRYIASRREAIV